MADRLEAPEELTLAVAGLLGRTLQAVVVSETSVGLELLADLQKSSRGRADVVGLEAVPVQSRSTTLSDPRVLGYVSDRLTFAEGDESLRALVVTRCSGQ